jgi:WD40 repeat protein
MYRRLAVPLFILSMAALACWSRSPVVEQPVPAGATDRQGDPLPAGALDRLGTLRLWHAFQMFSVAFSSDGKTLATSGSDGTIRVWDRATGKETKCFVVSKDDHVNCVTFSPDGKTLAFGRGSPHRCDFGLLNAESGKIVHRMFTGKWPVHSLIFTPDGKSLISGDYDSILIWDTTTPDTCERVNLPRDDKKRPSISTLALAADGKTLAVATDFRNLLVLWDLTAKKELRRWEAKVGWALALSPDGKILASTNPDRSLRLWDTATGKELAELKGHTDTIWTVAFSPDGKLLASAGDDGTIRLWDPVSGKEQHRFGQHYGHVRSLAFSPDGKTLVSAGSKIALWDVATQKDLLPTPGHKDGVFALALSPDGKTLASTGFDQTLRFWDLSIGREQRRIDVNNMWSGQSAFSPDGKTVAWSDDKTLCLADTATGQNLRRVETKAKLWCVAFSPNGTLLAAGTDFGIDLRNPADGKIIRTIDTPNNTALHLAFSPDGSAIAAANMGTDEEPVAVLWATATGKELVRLKGHTKEVRFVAFAPDGRQVLTGSRDETIRLWDVRTGKGVRRFEGPKDTVFAVAVSPDGNTVAGAVKDGTVRLWETATGRERCRFEGHRSWAMSVVFSPDGRRVISGSCDTTCLVWDVTGLMTEKGLRRVELGADEWATLWADLAGADAGKAHRAIWKTVASESSAQRLGERLRPIPPAEAERVAKLVTQLDSEEFKERESAQRELEELADIAEPSLQRALTSKPSPEAQRRIEEILRRTRTTSPERLRTWRALEVLEQTASPEARKVLRSLAAGAPEARLTRDAQAALKRLKMRGR